MKDGRPPTEGPVLHAESFHPVSSYDENIQNTSADTGWTNKMMDHSPGGPSSHLQHPTCSEPIKKPTRQLKNGKCRNYGVFVLVTGQINLTILRHIREANDMRKLWPPRGKAIQEHNGKHTGQLIIPSSSSTLGWSNPYSTMSQKSRPLSEVPALDQGTRRNLESGSPRRKGASRRPSGNEKKRGYLADHERQLNPDEHGVRLIWCFEPQIASRQTTSLTPDLDNPFFFLKPSTVLHFIGLYR